MPNNGDSVCADRGKVVHASWRDHMIEQGREVSPGRMSQKTVGAT
jgi:hypothetical protein